LLQGQHPFVGPWQGCRRAAHPTPASGCSS
jgi:hypothetical protein